MKHRIALLLAALAPVAALALPMSGCDCTPITLTLTQSYGPISAKAAQTVWVGKCDKGSAPEPTPTLDPQALMAPGGACAAAEGDEPCVVCVKESCCIEAEACSSDDACARVVTWRSATGGTADSCAVASDCDAKPDAAYNTVQACVASHCADACPRLQ